MGVINTLFYLQYRYEQVYVIENAFKKFHQSREVLHMSRMDRLSFEDASKRLETILHVKMLKNEAAGDFREGKMLGRQRELTVYSYEGAIYLSAKNPRDEHELILSYVDDKLENKTIFLFALAIDLSVMLFFLYVIRRIWPLRELKNSIIQFAEGNLDIHTTIQGKDEIADVSNEFDKTIAKIKQLQSSRNLFLRNIMHELKTPIAKGKLITDLLDDAKNAQRLSLIFSRFEHLLSEFSKIERVTSNEFNLNKKAFRTIDILDNAFDILMVEKAEVTIDIESESEIEADFELFSIALKNLIDNALKYGASKPAITISKEYINVCSGGDKLDTHLFENVFNRKFEDSSKGLGLGIYISKSIIEKHGYSLHYFHQEGINTFRIHLDKITLM